MAASPEYSIEVQAKIPSALAALHNFIRIHDPDDWNEEPLNLTSHVAPNHDRVAPAELGGYISHAERERASTKRDEIAEAMWASYQAVVET